MFPGFEAVLSSVRSRSQLAQRAGIQRSTIYRAVEGGSDVRMRTLQELAFAAGLELRLTLVPLSDSCAADAARVMVDQLELPRGKAREIEAWIDRLERYVGDGSVEDLLIEAGNASSLLSREGAIGMVGPFSVDRLASAGYSSGADWALSGSAALDALGAQAPDAGPQVLWTPFPRTMFQLLADTGAGERELGDADLIICEPTELTLKNATTIDGIRLVAPMQSMIDCYGLGDLTRSAARQIVRTW